MWHRMFPSVATTTVQLCTETAVRLWTGCKGKNKGLRRSPKPAKAGSLMPHQTTPAKQRASIPFPAHRHGMNVPHNDLCTPRWPVVEYFLQAHKCCEGGTSMSRGDRGQEWYTSAIEGSPNRMQGRHYEGMNNKTTTPRTHGEQTMNSRSEEQSQKEAQRHRPENTPQCRRTTPRNSSR